MGTKKPTTNQIETMAIEIRDFLLEHDIWQDVTIFFSGKAYSTSDGRRDFCNNPNNLIVLENRVTHDVAKLADLLGHSSIETTRIYLLSTGAEHARQLEGLGLVQ